MVFYKFPVYSLNLGSGDHNIKNVDNKEEILKGTNKNLLINIEFLTVMPQTNLLIASYLQLYVSQELLFFGKCSDIFLELAVVHKVGEVIRIWEVWETHHLFGRVGKDRLVNAGSAFLCVVL